jgi:hypothetical protein
MGPLYNVSELVLQLDAYGNPYVKLYEDPPKPNSQSESGADEKDNVRISDSGVEAVTAQDIGQSPTGLESQTQVNRKKRTENKMMYDKASIYIPTTADYITFALSNFRAAIMLEKSLFHVFCFHWVTSRFSDLKKIQKYKEAFAEMKDIVNKDNHRDWATIFVKMDCYSQRKALMTMSSIYELNKLTTLIASTKEGAMALASCGKDVMDAIMKNRQKLTKAKAQEALSFITALTANIESKGVDMGPGLCTIGIYSAALTGKYLSLNHYLTVAIKRNYPTTVKIFDSLHSTVDRIIQAQSLPQNLQEDKSLIAALGRSDLLTILTGWEAGGVPDYNETRRPSFSMLVRDNHGMYMEYIAALGHFGASEALWYEFTHPDATPMPPPPPAMRFRLRGSFNDMASPITEKEDIVTSTRHRIKIFTNAFIYAKDLKRACEVLESTQEPGFAYSSQLLRQQDLVKIAVLKDYARRGERGIKSRIIIAALDNLYPLQNENIDLERILPNIERLLGVGGVEIGERVVEGFCVEDKILEAGAIAGVVMAGHEEKSLEGDFVPQKTT